MAFLINLEYLTHISHSLLPQRIFGIMEKAKATETNARREILIPKESIYHTKIGSFMKHFLAGSLDAHAIGEELKALGQITLISTTKSVTEDASLCDFMYTDLANNLNKDKGKNFVLNQYAKGFKFTDFQMYSNCRGDTNMYNFVRGQNLSQSELERLKSISRKLFKDLATALKLLISGMDLSDSPDPRQTQVHFLILLVVVLFIILITIYIKMIG